MKSKTAMSFLGILLLAGAAYAQETRTELKRADLTGTNMEIWTAVYEFPVGYTIPVHSHKGEEVVYVLEGAKLKRPDGTEVELKLEHITLSRGTLYMAAPPSWVPAR